MFGDIFQYLTVGTGILLFFSLLLAFAFEAVNGFHDTANAVATVIYTKSLKPTTAVVWSGLMNMAGILLGGIGVAYSIVHLLPVDLLVNIHTGVGLAMIFSLLISALIWNLGTWALGLPASSSHALIGSILGVGIANSLYNGGGVFGGVNTHKLTEVGISLLISPTIGFLLSAGLLWYLKRSRAGRVLDQAPAADKPTPFWVKAILCGTCTGVSLAHGSNDGQKGMGLVMLILIGLLPAQFALNLQSSDQARVALESAHRIEILLDDAFALENQPRNGFVTVGFLTEDPTYLRAKQLLSTITQELEGKGSFSEFSAEKRWEFRQKLLRLDSMLVSLEMKAATAGEGFVKKFRNWRHKLRGTFEYVPTWVILFVTLALGLGTMVGWKRIVVTVGEKIGKSHLTYGQGAAAELVAMSTIGMADAMGLPVSTTHVLSSGVAGTMWANRSGVNRSTMKSILLAWILTLPATVLLSSGLFLLARFLL